MESREARNFEVEVTREGGAAVLRLRGEIDGFAQEAMDEGYSRSEALGTGVVVLDFTEVGYINSTGIALIVGILAKARASKRRIMACGLSEHYVEIFSITRLSDFMSLFPDARTAVEAGENES